MEFIYELIGGYGVVGVIISTAIAVFFAIHAIRGGQNMYWLWILFAFPFLGSVVYFFAIYLPSSRLEYAMKQSGQNLSKLLNPTKELKQAQKDYEITPSVKNLMRIGQAQIQLNQNEQASATLDECVKQTFSKDIDVLFMAAQAKVNNNEPQAALQYLREMRALKPDYKAAEVSLLAAHILSQTGQKDKAQEQYEYLVKEFGSDIRYQLEYAIWLAENSRWSRANELKSDIDQHIKHWPKHARMLHKDYLKELKAAFSKQPQ